MREMSEWPAALVTMLRSVRGLGSVQNDEIGQNRQKQQTKHRSAQQTCVHGDRLWKLYWVKNVGKDGSWELILDLCDVRPE